MIDTYEFLREILDTVTEHIVVIDHSGEIVYVNQSWIAFGSNNQCNIDRTWEGVNYLDVCASSVTMGDNYGQLAIDAISGVIRAEASVAYLEYPCHSPSVKRWFMMRVTPFSVAKAPFFVISHSDITERHLAEEEIRTLSRIDGLTQVANRRTFDDFFQDELRRCDRLGIHISLALFDIDHFKQLNDRYGHLQGDSCLREVAQTLQAAARRPGDLCARYGGEEFVIVFGGTNIDDALSIVNNLLQSVHQLQIPNEDSSVGDLLTISAGLVSLVPNSSQSPEQLIKMADQGLYRAKSQGRNRVEVTVSEGAVSAAS